MPANDQRRGRSVDLQPDWLEMVGGLCIAYQAGEHPRAEGRKRTQEELGVELARAAGRSEPFSDATVNRYLKGMQITDEMTRALSGFFDLPYPIFSARSVAEAQWFEAGQALATDAPELFSELLESALDAVRITAELGRLRRRTKRFPSPKSQGPVIEPEHASSGRTPRRRGPGGVG